MERNISGECREGGGAMLGQLENMLETQEIGRHGHQGH
jgi:hypothetical protein